MVFDSTQAYSLAQIVKKMIIILCNKAISFTKT